MVLAVVRRVARGMEAISMGAFQMKRSNIAGKSPSFFVKREQH